MVFHFQHALQFFQMQVTNFEQKPWENLFQYSDETAVCSNQEMNQIKSKEGLIYFLK